MNQIHLDTARLMIQVAPLVFADRWKLENLGRLAKANPKKFNDQLHALERLLGET